MFKRIALFLLLVCVPTLAVAQDEPTVYTYSAHWEVPRASWSDFTADNGSTEVLNRLVSEGTLIAWGNDEVFVHAEDGTTHGTWFSAAGFAGIERTLDELAKLPAGGPAISGIKHHDHFGRSLMHGGRTTSEASGYMWVDIEQVEPGQGRQWLNLQRKHFKPIYDRLLADGTILHYQVSVQYVHRNNPRTRTTTYIVPSAEALNKVDAAFQALYEEEGPSIFAGLGSTANRVQHRDVLSRVTSFTHK